MFSIEVDGKDIIEAGMTASLVERGVTTVEEIASDITVETSDSLEDNLYKYRAREERYVPVPEDGKYYDVVEDETRLLTDEMVIQRTVKAEIAVQRLAHVPFLLVDRYPEPYFSVTDSGETKPTLDDSPDDNFKSSADFLSLGELDDEYPEAADQYRLEKRDKRYLILLPSDINKREARKAFYPLIAEFTRGMAEEIKKEYPDSEPLVDQVGRRTAEAWNEEMDSEVEVHISELMNLTDMRNLIENSTQLASRCGFITDKETVPIPEVESMEDFRTHSVELVFNQVKDFRNRVMHPNRPVLNEREDLERVIISLDYLYEFISELDSDVEVKTETIDSEESR